jgi:hypothetical protein
MIVYYQKLIDECDDHSVFNDVANFLHKNHNATLVEVDSYNPVNINGIDTTIWDCELVVYFPNENIVKAISFADTPYKMIDFLKIRNNKNDILLLAQYQDDWGIVPFKVVPTIYTRMNPYVCLDTFYAKRNELKNFRDVFTFRGNVDNADRGSAKILKNNEYFLGHNHINMIDYYNELITCKVGLAIPGVGEKCHRDVEYMAIGLPFMKFEYIAKWNPILVPNYHYISIDRIDPFYGHERIGGEQQDEAYLNKFKEVKDNAEFLDFISKNARNYYEDNLHPIKRVKSIISELNI